MKNAVVATVVGLSIAVGSSAAFAVPTTANLNTGFLTDLGAIADPSAAWFFNFTSQGNHHAPIGLSKSGGDYTTLSGGSLIYEDAVRTNGDTVDVGLTIKGYSGFNTDPLFDVPEIIRHDFVGSSQNNGIGVMSEGTSSEEQVNTENGGEYLHLAFSRDITLQGFDFASGEHSDCGSSRNCGSFKLFALDTDTDTTTFLTDGFLSSAAYTVLDETFVGSNFLMLSSTPEGTNSGEFGWYLSGIAGDAAPVPEPATVALLGLGLAGVGFARRRRERKA